VRPIILEKNVSPASQKRMDGTEPFLMDIKKSKKTY
jgi:hypothetical protein